ncbi:Ubiquitin carboxyl-terminal hydrolase 21 [Quaeritorhiza haematococci]|nr:Ubiquitin carboxyl-terminal hydrolase 21 [Quaeritorhiza haematococci]
MTVTRPHPLLAHLSTQQNEPGGSQRKIRIPPADLKIQTHITELSPGVPSNGRPKSTAIFIGNPLSRQNRRLRKQQMKAATDLSGDAGSISPLECSVLASAGTADTGGAMASPSLQAMRTGSISPQPETPSRPKSNFQKLFQRKKSAKKLNRPLSPTVPDNQSVPVSPPPQEHGIPRRSSSSGQSWNKLFNNPFLRSMKGRLSQLVPKLVRRSSAPAAFNMTASQKEDWAVNRAPRSASVPNLMEAPQGAEDGDTATEVNAAGTSNSEEKQVLEGITTKKGLPVKPTGGAVGTNVRQMKASSFDNSLINTSSTVPGDPPSPASSAAVDAAPEKGTTQSHVKAEGTNSNRMRKLLPQRRSSRDRDENNGVGSHQNPDTVDGKGPLDVRGQSDGSTDSSHRRREDQKQGSSKNEQTSGSESDSSTSGSARTKKTRRSWIGGVMLTAFGGAARQSGNGNGSNDLTKQVAKKNSDLSVESTLPIASALDVPNGYPSNKLPRRSSSSRPSSTSALGRRSRTQSASSRPDDAYSGFTSEMAAALSLPTPERRHYATDGRVSNSYETLAKATRALHDPHTVNDSHTTRSESGVDAMMGRVRGRSSSAKGDNANGRSRLEQNDALVSASFLLSKPSSSRSAAKGALYPLHMNNSPSSSGTAIRPLVSSQKQLLVVPNPPPIAPPSTVSSSVRSRRISSPALLSSSPSQFRSLPLGHSAAGLVSKSSHARSSRDDVARFPSAIMQKPARSLHPQVLELLSMKLPEKSLPKYTVRRQRDVPRGLFGLNNNGNTCFMNSVMQCILATEPLIGYFLSGDYKSDLNDKSDTKGHIALVFSDLVREFWRTDSRSGSSYSLFRSKSLNPAAFKNEIDRWAPQFVGGFQHDAQEFLRFMLDGLHEDLNRVVRRPKFQYPDGDVDKLTEVERARFVWNRYHAINSSFVFDVFGGLLQSTITCHGCGRESSQFEPFWDLSLPIPVSKVNGTHRPRPSISGVEGPRCTLHECLRAFAADEVLDELYHCAHCNGRHKANKCLRLYRCPEVLVLHLKRFEFTAYARNKITANVIFPIESLSLTDFLSGLGGSDLAGEADGGPPLYDLYGVVSHSGYMNSGHYVALTRNLDDGKWYSKNDATSGPCMDPWVILSVPSRDGNSSVTVPCWTDPEAYVLFYRRRRT